MATGFAPLTFASAVVAVIGTSVAPSGGLPPNCTVVVLRNSGVNTALFGIGVPGTTVLVAGANSMSLLAGATLALPLGVVDKRGIMDEAVLPGSGLIFDALVGATTVELMYENALGTSF